MEMDKTVSTPISNVAIFKDIYGKDGILEGELNRIETEVALVISKIIESKMISDDNANLLLFYIIIQHQRTLKVVKTFIDSYKEQCNVLNRRFGDSELTKSIPSVDYVSTISLQIVSEAMDRLGTMNAVLIENKASSSFITSDSPVVVYNHVIECSPYSREYGFGVRGLQIFFPLSPDLCLFYYDATSYRCNYKFYKIKKPRLVDDINTLVLINANRFIYYSNQSSADYIKRIHEKYSVISASQSKFKKNASGLIVDGYYMPLDEPGEMVDVYGRGNAIMLSFGGKRKKLKINLPFCVDLWKFDGNHHELPKST